MRLILTILSLTLLFSCKKQFDNERHYFGAVIEKEKGNPHRHDTVVVVPQPTPDIVPPYVNILTPINNANYHVGDVITISGQALDNYGIINTWWSLDGAMQETSVSYQPKFIFNTSVTNAGTHKITLSGKDPSGNIGSASILINLDSLIVPVQNLPSVINLNTPPVMNQGSEGSCVSCAVGYYGRSIEQYYKTGATAFSYSTNIFSPEYLYNQTKISDCGSGSALVVAVNFITTNGIITWQSMPYSDQNGCTLIPSVSQIQEAATYKIKYYSLLKATDIQGIKTMLYYHHPLIFTFTVDDNFYRAGLGFIWKTLSPIVYAPHCVTIVGYDDSKHAYKIVNQWGTNWGDGGFTYIDYDLFKTIAFDLYVLHP